MSRYVFFGTSEIAATVLGGLCDRDWAPSLVVTPPDRRRGRGRKLVECEAARVARERALPVHKTADVNDARSREIAVGAADRLALLCEFGQIIGAELLDEILVLNVHPSLLPRWRGAAPIERAIMAGDHETGVCIMKLEAGLDTGPVSARERVAITRGETYGQLSSRLAEIAVGMAAEAIENALAGRIEFAPQVESGVTYADKIEPEERRLDPSRPAEQLARVIRALTPHIGAYLEFENGERLGVEAATVKVAPVDAEPGRLEAEKDGILVRCGEDALRLDRVKPPGGRAMSSADLIRGRGLPGVRAV